ncbi:MAG: glycosyltransferase family 1 protein [Sphingobacteriia bacterium]|nr:glycosyltransferase family 1 protein [Sphingobacteriia bacterium]
MMAVESPFFLKNSKLEIKIMKIAIQAADLDNERIDGTRVYLLNVLKYLGKISSKDEFFIYHRNDFNPALEPADFFNYKIKKLGNFKLWTQTKFAFNIWRDQVDILWMPMHNLPFFRSKTLKATVTIHDLAFKKFPQTFPKRDLLKLNFLTDLAVNFSDKIIAVSESTRGDILKFYPKIKPEKIRVIYHGFDAELFQKKYPKEMEKTVLERYTLDSKKYFLYVGAIQPRKNLPVLIRAFEIFKEERGGDCKLVLAGGRAWCWEETLDLVEKSSWKKEIVLTEKISFEDLAILYRNARLFVFPSLYEGFGIPVLEAFASGVPAVVARNSSLTEVGGEAAEYFQSDQPSDLKEKLIGLITNEERQKELVAKGKEQLGKFSWEKCARETWDYLTEK